MPEGTLAQMLEEKHAVQGGLDVLIIRLSSAGDVLLTSPLIRILRARSKKIRIHFLVKPAFAPLVAHHPDLYKMHLWAGSVHAIQTAMQPHFTNGAPDLILDLQRNRRSTAFCRAWDPVPYRQVVKENIRKWIRVQWGLGSAVDHIVDRYLQTAADLNLKPDQKGLEFHIPKSAHAVWDRAELKELKELKNSSFVALALGAAHRTKSLEPDQFLRLCRNIQEPIVLLGGRDQAALGQYLAGKAGPRIHNLAGVLSWEESGAVLQKSRLVITHDTGLMHMAAALQVPLISVWGSSHPDFGMAPYRAVEIRRFQVEGLHCRPCSKLGYGSCPRIHFDCMRTQDLGALVNLVNLK